MWHIHSDFRLNHGCRFLLWVTETFCGFTLNNMDTKMNDTNLKTGGVQQVLADSQSRPQNSEGWNLWAEISDESEINTPSGLWLKFKQYHIFCKHLSLRFYILLSSDREEQTEIVLHGLAVIHSSVWRGFESLQHKVFQFMYKINFHFTLCRLSDCWLKSSENKQLTVFWLGKCINTSDYVWIDSIGMCKAEFDFRVEWLLISMDYSYKEIVVLSSIR